MDQRRRRLVQLNIAVIVFHIVTTVLCVAMRWPAQFGGAGDPDNVASEMWVRGTAIGAPAVLTIVLALATLAVSRPGRVGGVGAVVIVLVSLLIIVGGSGEAFGAPSPDVPTAVLILSGVVNVLLSLITLYRVYQLTREFSEGQGFGSETGQGSSY
ncbi:hypothetical protein [Allorhizocola rhizosphaerae]|uniref:hypothetical protein n=1 Tax=Allorhizocola rhizosphaerae TaxID=1872709 RepID=UPI0013C34814|nr:hypothetical protein [Allorhizocola rhizosphaerae]